MFGGLTLKAAYKTQGLEFGGHDCHLISITLIQVGKVDFKREYPEWMKIQFLGAAGEVTGSRHLIEANVAGRTHHFLVDYGMFQGGREVTNKNLEPLPIPPKELDFVVLTHAHIDHSGLLPRLCTQGLAGPIYCTKASYELLKILLPDSAHLQSADLERAKHKVKLGKWHGEMPVVLYSQNEVDAALS